MTEGVTAGFEVVVRPIEGAVEAVGADAPDAIIVEGGDGPPDRAILLLESLAPLGTGPVVVISPNDGMGLRLAIARADTGCTP